MPFCRMKPMKLLRFFFFGQKIPTFEAENEPLQFHKYWKLQYGGGRSRCLVKIYILLLWMIINTRLTSWEEGILHAVCLYFYIATCFGLGVVCALLLSLQKFE